MTNFQENRTKNGKNPYRNPKNFSKFSNPNPLGFLISCRFTKDFKNP